MKKKRIRVNEMIRAPQVRVIGAEGEQLGVMNPAEGLRRVIRVIVKQNKVVSNMPGIIPAINNFPTDCCVIRA